MRLLSRRPLLAAPALLLPGLRPALAATDAQAGDTAPAPAADPRMAERGVGNADAPVVVQEFFSLTCSHCAAFHKEIYPRIKKDLIDTGIVRMVWRDFPLDRLALAAAAVARSLPVDRYEGFIGTLLANQDRWAFTRGNPVDALASMAALAGMPRAKFDEVLGDEALQRGILEQRATWERDYRVEATPSFNFKGKGPAIDHKGGMPFDEFRKLVEQARKG